jgi:transcriptional regulator with XRE-family HTH domain
MRRRFLANPSSPSARSRRLAAELLRLRELSGLTREDVAERLTWSTSKLWRVETARSRAHHGDVADLLDIYGVTGDQQESLIKLAREARRRGWWHSYSDVLADGFDTYVDLEAEASAIRTYESQLVPGLLQTVEYAQAVLTAAWVTVEADEIDRRVAVRTRRQELAAARGTPLQLWAILDEAVLRRVVGSPQIMRTQLDRLADAARQTNVTLQVLPFSSGAHIAMLGTFVLLTFPEPADPDIIYLETDTSSLYLEEPQDISRYSEIFDHLRATALAPRESVTFISTVAAEYA